MPVKLSYIIPVYNGEKSIPQTLDSIFAIGLKESDIEIIVIDDCSTDNTRDVLNDIQKAYSNLVVLHHEQNQRQGAARNRGIEIARGEYIAFCDADDEVVPEGVLNALQAVEKSHADICYFEFEYERPDGEWQLFGMPQETHDTILAASDYLNKYYTCYYNAPWRCLYRTDFLKNIGIRFVEGVRWEDCDWTVKVYARAKEIQFVNGIGYRYHWNEQATSQLTDVQAISEQLMAGVRLNVFAKEIQFSLQGLSLTIADEGKYRYIVNNIRLRNVTKYSFSQIKKIYNLVSVNDWKVISNLHLPVWERIFVKYHSLSLIVLSLACPIASLGRRVVEYKRNLI